MKRFILKFKTAASLGFINCTRVIIHRMNSKIGLYGLYRNVNTIKFINNLDFTTSFFYKPINISNLVAPKSWHKYVAYFGQNRVSTGETPPNWLANPFQPNLIASSIENWWKPSDSIPDLGDIKFIWEASRFDWVLAFAMQAKTGDTQALDKLNVWLTDWNQQNPPYRGVNWKCGQEASFRVLHLTMATLILGQTRAPSPALMQFIELHLRRISQTLSYAIAQNNNHATSEAAALFVGGSWLAHVGVKHANRWQSLGRHYLEQHALNLIETDGSFSQYSLNYHRVLLDTYCMAEIWRRHMALPDFSHQCQSRLTAAAQWLAVMVTPRTGDAPNLGANDGARLFQLTDTDYRDYRPTVQLAMVLFCHCRVYRDDGLWNQPLTWFNLQCPEKFFDTSKSQCFDQGGFAVLKKNQAMVLLRYPRFRFRPSQADALHLDLWVNSENVLRDGGTYSYHTEGQWLDYFHGTASHNTVQFDDRDQMPKMNRFLFGDWLKTQSIKPLLETPESIRFGACYQDRQAAVHSREIQLGTNDLQIIDEVSGFQQRAVLRWRLRPGNWILLGQTISDGTYQLTVQANSPIVRYELVQGWESRYYMQKEMIPVLEIEINQPGRFITEVQWAL